MPVTIRLQREPNDAAAERAKLTHGRTDIGAEIARHVEAAECRWSLLGVTVIHRHGRIVPGEDIVLVLTASSHRHEAFAAAEFLMDYLKTRAPFWKRVERPAGGNWVEAKASDDSAADRWTRPPGRRDAAE